MRTKQLHLVLHCSNWVRKHLAQISWCSATNALHRMFLNIGVKLHANHSRQYVHEHAPVAIRSGQKASMNVLNRHSTIHSTANHNLQLPSSEQCHVDSSSDHSSSKPKLHASHHDALAEHWCATIPHPEIYRIWSTIVQAYLVSTMSDHRLCVHEDSRKKMSS